MMVESALPHIPVMRERVAQLLATAPSGVVVDATLGAGGHAVAVLRARITAGRSTRLLGIDRDPVALQEARRRLDQAAQADTDVTLVQSRFDRLDAVLDEHETGPVAGILFDLGLSSMQLDEGERGFSYRRDGPLDMRMGPDAPRSAATLIAESTERELASILSQWGEERFAGRVARAIKRAPVPVSTTELAQRVRDAIPAATRRTGGHPATRTFQALRIAVNGELDALAHVLPVALARLAPGGMMIVLAYHSLEDRLVKRAFTDAATGCICPPDFPVCACGRVPLVDHLVRRPLRPAPDELERNRRASAARLRAVRRRADPTETS